MALPAIQAAKILCEITDGTLTNMRIHKILYLCHVMYIGKKKEPLFDEHFEAWKYGPVIPSLYHDLKCYSAQPITYILGSSSLYEQDKEKRDEFNALKEYGAFFNRYTTADLLVLTHCEGGAWSRVYDKGVMNKVIPNEYIMKEYKDFYE